jgi:hypothetical protein
VDRIDYGKGPYYADQGDFSSAGYSRFHTLHRLPEGFVKLTGGQYDYYRLVGANSNQAGDGDLLYAGEFNFFNGPWVVKEDGYKYNGMLRYTVDHEDWGYAVNGKAYNSSSTATNQIPQRAMWDKVLSLYGSMDSTDGGDTHRYTMVGNLWSKGENYKNDLNVYAVYYDLNLFSNFTGYLEDQTNGDQIQQKKRQVVAGAQGEQPWFHTLMGFEMDNSLGFQVRYDGNWAAPKLITATFRPERPRSRCSMGGPPLKRVCRVGPDFRMSRARRRGGWFLPFFKGRKEDPGPFRPSPPSILERRNNLPLAPSCFHPLLHRRMGQHRVHVLLRGQPCLQPVGMEAQGDWRVHAIDDPETAEQPGAYAPEPLAAFPPNLADARDVPVYQFRQAFPGGRAPAIHAAVGA